MPEQFSLTPIDTSLLIFDFAGTLAKCDGKLIKGVKDTLQCLFDRGFTLAIATSMSHTGLNDLLHENGVTELFAHNQTSDMGLPKPDPKMLDAVLLGTATEAKQAIMIGDSTFDIQMAHDADIKAIGVLTGCDTEEQFEVVKPLLVLNSVNDLVPYLSA